MIEVSTAPPWMPWRSSSAGEQSVRRAEARPARGDREHAVLRAQILRDQRHRGAVAAMAGDHHELLDAGARDAFAERHPVLQRGLGRQRQRARIIDMLGGNADRLHRQEGRRECWPATARAPAPDRPRAIMTSVPSGRCGPCCSVAASGSTAIQRAASAAGNVGPVDVGPVAGQERSKSSSEAFHWMDLQGSLSSIRRTLSRPGRIRRPCLPSWARTIDGVQS